MLRILGTTSQFLAIHRQRRLRRAIPSLVTAPDVEFVAVTKQNIPKCTMAELFRSSAMCRAFTQRIGLALAVCCVLCASAVQAQFREPPPHGKMKLDSYRHVLRDVHPASQAQANSIEIRLFLSGLKKAERLERKERLDGYAERQAIKLLQKYNRIAKRLAFGRTTSAVHMDSFWILVAMYGDQADVYDALSGDVPTILHDEFVPTSGFMQILRPDGRLTQTPFLLQRDAAIDAARCELAWSSLAKKLKAAEIPTATDVDAFAKSVDEYRARYIQVANPRVPYSTRLNARKYLDALRSLAGALHRPQQCDQIERYLASTGYSYHGHNVLELIQHMLEHRVMPAQGSTAQLAVAEVARPISRLLDEEISIRYERIDSLGSGQGHRPYVREYNTSYNQHAPAPGDPAAQQASL